MSVNNYYNNPEKDTLQVNMELVSKELNELIINEENDYGIMQAQVHTSYTAYHPAPPTNVHAVDNIPGKTNLYEKHSSHYMCYERQQEREQIPTSQTFYTNPSNNSYVVASSKLLHPPNLTKQLSSRPAVYPYTYTDIACVNTETPRTLQMLPNNGTTYTYTASNEYQSLPKYKFHYLRSHNETGKMTSPPLISMTTREDTQAATFRKHPKSYVKHNIRSPTSSFPDYNYNNIVVDLSVLGISEDGKEPNQVLRLFALFRDLHNAIAEVLPSPEPSPHSAYVATFAPLPKASVMPCTMNVQCQVKHVIAQMLIFLNSMQRLVAINVVYDRLLAAECESYLFKLRQIFAQFEMYKFLDLEHKRGQFIDETVRAHAEHLEKLMEQMNRQIREVHLRIVAFDWYIGKHCRYGTELNKVQSGNTDDLNSCINPSKIGVINEILQMYGNTAQTSAITTTLDTTTTITTTMTNTITETDCLVVSENSTNEILSGADSVTPPTTTSVNVIATDCLAKFAGATGNTVATNTHIRQPVFYIG